VNIEHNISRFTLTKDNLRCQRWTHLTLESEAILIFHFCWISFLTKRQWRPKIATTVPCSMQCSWLGYSRFRSNQTFRQCSSDSSDPIQSKNLKSMQQRQQRSNTDHDHQANATPITAIKSRARTSSQCKSYNSNPKQSKNLDKMQQQ
jgi:hypothetical protein